jgi:hypothetical protein
MERSSPQPRLRRYTERHSQEHLQPRHMRLRVRPIWDLRLPHNLTVRHSTA